MQNTPPVRPAFEELYDKSGEPLGAILGPEAWILVRDIILTRFAPAVAKEIPEPLSDWNELVQFWDFKYAVDRDCACPLCGNSTENWERDEPRKFRLTAANLGGLVTFRCMSCKAKLLKRHFKDVIKVEAKPFQEERSIRNLGRPA